MTTTNVEYSSDIRVELIRSMASDDMVVQAAQVSAKGENNPDTVPGRLIDSLMRQKHGSPFEHNSFTFFVEVPIFVAREWHTHRMSSFNEMSGRYTQLKPKFYLPSADRPTRNTGTSMKPIFVRDENHLNVVQDSVVNNSLEAWNAYSQMLDAGVANEVARMVLPLNVYTQFYWTVNARSMMNFLSLRIHSEDSRVESFPQLEIQMGAEKVEAAFHEMMPKTHTSFVNNGRVAP